MTLEAEMRVFVEVLDRRAFSEAAKRLQLSNASITRLFKAFESRFQPPLIQRKPGRLELLPFGSEVYNQASAALKEIDGLLDLSSGVSSRHSIRRLRIACSPELATTLLQPVLQSFSKAVPFIDVELMPSDAGDSAKPLDAYVGFAPPELAGLAVRHSLGEEQHIFVASPQLQKIGLPVPTNFEAFGQSRYIWLGERRKQTWQVSRRRDHWEEVKLSGLVADSDAAFVLEVVTKGLGIGILPSWLVADAIAKEALVRVYPRWKVALPGTARVLSVFSDPASPHSTALHRFIAYFKESLVEKSQTTVSGRG